MATSRAKTVFPDVTVARSLTGVEVRTEVPASPGIYAAWIVDQKALAQAGIDGPAPRLIYVGISRTSVRSRLLRHVLDPFLPMEEILATRGLTLPPWGLRCYPDTGRMVRYSPLLEVSADQALAWLHKHLRWSWVLCDGPRARASELAAIRELGPLLNASHSLDPMPSQLRYGSRYKPARARWLWQMSWAALRIGNFSYEDEKDEWRIKHETRRTLRYKVAVDDLGYPLPISDAKSRDSLRSFEIPDADSIWELMRVAASDAPAIVREALIGEDVDPDDDELDAWWGAHLGAPLLPSPVSIEMAMRQTMALSNERQAAGPERLPGPDRVDELVRLVRRVPGVGH